VNTKIKYIHITSVLLIIFLFHNCASISKNIRVKKQQEPVEETKDFDISPSILESFLNGEIYYMNKNYAKAIIEYQEVISQDSSSARVYFQLAKSYLNLNKHNQGLKNLKIAKRKEPHNTEIRKLLADLYLQKDNLNKSLAEYKYLYQKNPDDAKIGYRYSWILTRQQKYDTAKKVLDDLYKKHPRKANILKQMTRLNLKMGQLDSTKKYLDQLIQLKPNNEKYLSLRGKIALGEDELGTARFIYERLVNLNPEKDRYRKILNDLLINSTDFNKAEKYFKNQLKSSSDTSNYINLINLYRKHEKFEKALSRINSGLKKYSDYSHFYFLKGSVYSSLNKNQKAIKNYQKAYQLSPDNLQYAHTIANFWEKMKNFDKSDSLYKELIKKNPQDAISYNNLAYSYAVREINLDKAIQYVNKALSIEPKNPSFLDTKGWILYKKGNLKKAKNLIQQSLENINNGNAEIYEHLGDIFHELNKPEKARDFYEKAQKIEPNNKRIQNKLTNF